MPSPRAVGKLQAQTARLTGLLLPAGKFFPVEQAPEEPARGFYKAEVDRVPADSPIEKVPLDQTKDPIRSRPKKVVLVLREDKVGDLANSLQEFAPKGSQVTVISKEKPEVRDHTAYMCVVVCGGMALLLWCCN